MDDKEENKEVEEEDTTEDTGERDVAESTELIDSANAAAEGLKTENDRKEKLVEREERLEARRALGGTSEAGRAPEKPAEITPEEYSNKFLDGEVDIEK